MTGITSGPKTCHRNDSDFTEEAIWFLFGCSEVANHLRASQSVFEQFCNFAFIWLIRMGLENQTYETCVLREDMSHKRRVWKVVNSTRKGSTNDECSKIYVKNFLVLIECLSEF